MRIVVMTVAAIALLTIPTRAQQMPTPGSPPYSQLPKMDKSDHPDEHTTATKTDDKAYQSALDAIPQPKNYDPWRNVRQAPAPQSK